MAISANKQKSPEQHRTSRCLILRHQSRQRSTHIQNTRNADIWTGLIAPPAQDQQASASDFSFGLEFPQFIPSGISGPEASYVLDSLLGLLDIEEDNSEPEPEFDSDVGSSGDRENEDERP